LKVLKKCKYHWITTVKNNRRFLFNKVLTSGKDIKKKFSNNQFRYYPAISLYVRAFEVKLRGYGGMVKLAIVKNGRSANLKNTRFILTDLTSLSAAQIVKTYQTRWSIEVIFRDFKQLLNFEKCQMRSWEKITGHIEMVFLAYFLLESVKEEKQAATLPEVVRHLQENYLVH